MTREIADALDGRRILDALSPHERDVALTNLIARYARHVR
jgi:hypothetical protein